MRALADWARYSVDQLRVYIKEERDQLGVYQGEERV